MFETARARRGMVTSSHHLAAEAGLRVLREGGNAIEAMVAAAATISVVYPHMNGLGGDGFWLISTPGRRPPRAITAVGAAGSAVDEAFYRNQGLDEIPSRGPLAANTVAATVSGWQMALSISAEWGGRLPIGRLLEDAIWHAREGVPVTRGQHRFTVEKRDELQDVPGWAGLFLADGAAPDPGDTFKQPALADTLQRLGQVGLDDFYRGTLGRAIAADLARVGSPIGFEDLVAQTAQETEPLSVGLRSGTVYNVRPPSQGLAALMILGLFDRLGVEEADGYEHVHGLVEATKLAVRIRNANVTDPAYMGVDAADFVLDANLDARVKSVNMKKALPWPDAAAPGDTVWLGAIDSEGRAVSFIHSIYWEFGSGVVLRDTGVQWQNRGSSFTLSDDQQNYVRPGRLPFHTNNPAMALLNDGRVMVYGAMGGEGQPQTQAAVYSRHVMFGQDLQQAITAPRWVLGRTWGEPRVELRVEDRFDPGVIKALRKAGHPVDMQPPLTDLMGHAGAIVLHPSGLMEGANDPRSDGAAVGY